MDITLNGGNYGGLTVTVEATVGSTVIAIKDNSNTFWLYDSALHPETLTADFFGCQDQAPEGALVIDFSGV